MQTPLFRLRNVKKSYSNHFTLSIDNLDFHCGKIAALVGPNGAGKTTLLRILATLLPPDSGALSIDNIEVNSHLSHSQLLSTRRKITFLSQKPLLFNRSVLSNVLYGLAVRKLPRRHAVQSAKAALRLVGALSLADRNGKTLSAGETQKVALARSLALEPEALLLDEPFANVSPEDIPSLENVLLERATSGSCIVIATHIPAGAHKLTDRIIYLRNGSVCKTPAENIFRAKVMAKDGEKFLCADAAPPIYAVTDKTGDVTASISPRDILISITPLSSSARNCLKGTITAAGFEGETVALTIDVGIKLTAVITKHSYSELALNIGKEVYLTFKATAVEIL
jgi:molybdopterin-binding protein